MATLAGGAYLAVTSRAHGSGTSQPDASASETARPSPLAGGTPQPHIERWLVAKAIRPVTVYRRPAADAPVKARLEKLNIWEYPNVFLVHHTRQVEGAIWYNVWLAMRPNGTRGWVREGQVAIYPTTAKIEIDLSERSLTVYRLGAARGTFPVAVGTPELPTPTGFFFVNQKLKPPSPGGAFGSLAIGISAFQPRLPDWPQGGPVAIHGTNEPQLIGQAVSHGCVRMYDKDVLKVGDWVPTGSPVIIHK